MSMEIKKNDLYDFEGQEDLISPQLIFYPELIRENIRHMIRMAGGPERLWPHIKTHKCAEVVKMQLEEGIDKVKCATIAELEMAAEAGAVQLVLAYPLVGPNIERFLNLTTRYPDRIFYAIADDTAQVQILGKKAKERGVTVPLLMDVDMGQHRTGVPLEKMQEAYPVWSRISGIRLCGAHCYDGHRHESDPEVRYSAVKDADEAFEAIRNQLESEGMDVSAVIFGGTPSFPCHIRITGDYVSPGTCTLWDLGYQKAYADLRFTPAAAVLTRVISRPAEDLFTIDLGTKAVACDPPQPRAGIIGMEYAQIVMHNEEHMVLRVPSEFIAEIPPVGTVLFAVPYHICPTTALYPEAAVVQEGTLKDWWKIDARNRRISV